jgi:hypothetical protein
MKKTLILLLPAITIAILLSSYSNDLMYPEGAPAGNTGSPGDGQNCTHCHNGSAATVQNWITSNVGVDGYLPGQTYTITVTVTGSGAKGFEVSPQSLTGNLLGTLIAGSGNKLVGSGKYVTHSSSSNANPKTWTFQWTAPVAGTGPVTMYGAFAVSKSATKLSTLVIPENLSTGVIENAVSESIKVFPNPADNNLNVSFNLSVQGEVRISLVNSATGSKSLLKQEVMSQGDQVCHLDCSSLADGLYILLVESGNRKYESKVVIRH